MEYQDIERTKKMFGYVRVNKPEMKVKEYEAYRGLYCSLCKAMGKHFGLLSRLTLSYDITFLVLMRLSFSSKVPDFKGGRCPFNLSKKCNYCQNGDEEMKYAAAVSMMLFYYKVKDNIADSGFFKRLLMYLILPYACLKNQKAKKMYPRVEKLICQSMERQAQIEKSKTDIPDKAAHESADALGKIMSYGFDDEDGAIYSFGYGIGKWVYLCDAADDMEKDLKSGSYNVFVNYYKLSKKEDIDEKVKQQIVETLNLSCAFACEAFHCIPDKTLVPIAENIIYEGTEIAVNTLMKGRMKK